MKETSKLEEETSTEEAGIDVEAKVQPHTTTITSRLQTWNQEMLRFKHILQDPRINPSHNACATWNLACALHQESL